MAPNSDQLRFAREARAGDSAWRGAAGENERQDAQSDRRAAAVACVLTACGGDASDPGRVTPTRGTPEATIARWVDTGDCSLMTDRYVSAGYRSVAEGRRACQAEADRTPPEPYRVQATSVDGDEAMVVLVVADGTRLTFWLIGDRERGWRIDGYQERPPGGAAIGAAEVIAGFERRTGERLDRLPDLSSLYYETLGFREFVEAIDKRPEDLSDRVLALVERFGALYIYVAESVDEAKRLVHGDGPDERGVHWQRRRSAVNRAPRWRADKRYGNVVLSWTAGKTRRTDRRFDLLDAILRRTARRAR